MTTECHDIFTLTPVEPKPGMVVFIYQVKSKGYLMSVDIVTRTCTFDKQMFLVGRDGNQVYAIKTLGSTQNEILRTK